MINRLLARAGCLAGAVAAALVQPLPAAAQGRGLSLIRDAEMVVNLSVAPDGHAYNSKAKGIDSPSLQLCVADALARTVYPRGPDHSDLQVQVLWTGRILTMTGSIVSHRPPSSSSLEGI